MRRKSNYYYPSSFWEEWFSPLVVVGGIVVLTVGFIWFAIWYNNRYPCIKYEARWREAYTSYRSQQVGDVTIMIPEYHPATWEQKCMARGDSRKGDVEAQHAPIPIEGIER